MASLSGEGMPGFSIKNGCKVFSDQAFTVEDVLLAMGEIVGHENIASASRMNKAVVVFLKDEKLVNSLVENGIVVSDTLVQVMPLRAPATKITISNAPPFISNEHIKELSRFGKFAGPIKMVPLGCKSAALKHVLSFRRQVFMFLNENSPNLDISFRIQHGDSSYMIFATTESLRCFECGDLGHKKFTCPHKKRSENGKNDGNDEEQNDQRKIIGSPEKEKRPIVVEEVVIPEKKQKTHLINEKISEDSVSAGEPSGLPRNRPTAEQSVIDSSSKVEVSEFISSMRAGDNAVGPNVLNDDVEYAYGDEEQLSISGSQSYTLVENENSDEELMEDCDNCSEVSEIDYSQSLDDVYSVEELNEFLDSTKGKKVDVLKHFPDVNKFIKSVVIAQKTVSYDIISKQKRFRLKKFLATVRKAQKENVKLLKGKK